jgi:hypothetical protein
MPSTFHSEVLGMGKDAGKKSGWLQRVWKSATREISSWSLWHYLFDFAVTTIITVLIHHFTGMPWWMLMVLPVSLFVAILSGWMVIQKARASLVSETARSELRRQKGIRKLFQDLMREGEAGRDWGEEQVANWISKVACAIRPLFPKEDVEQFEKEFEDKQTSVSQRRERCLIWLRAARLKFWVH